MPTEEEIAAQAAKPPIEVAAEQAIATAQAAAAKAAADAAAEKARADALAAKLAAAEAKPVATTVSPEAVAKLERMEAFMVKDHNSRRLAHAKTIGLDAPSLTEAEVLSILPDADPDTADGRAKFETFRQSRPGLFKTPGLSQASVLAALGDGLGELTKKSPLFNHDKLVGSVFGGKA